MKQVVEEQLSALLDGELPPGEEELLLRRLERESGYRERLVRYAVIGQLIRGEPAIGGGAVLAARIGAAVEAEPQPPAAATPAGRRWRAFALAGVAAAAGLLVIGSLVRQDAGPTPAAARTAPVPAVRPADFQPADAPIEPDRLMSYLVAHGDYAGGLTRQAVSLHVVNGTPEFILAGAQGAGLDD